MRRQSYLPGIQLGLLRLVLLQHFLQNLLQPVRVRLQRREHVLDSPLDQNSVDHAETLAVIWQRFKGLDDESGRGE